MLEFMKIHLILEARLEDTNITRQLYLDLIKKCITGLIYEDKPIAIVPIPGYYDRNPKKFIRRLREFGRDVPSQAHTMIGLRRMDNIQYCVEQVLKDQVPGDLKLCETE